MLHILVVEDDSVSAKLMMHLLKPYGHCDLASNGQQASDLFSAALESGEIYDVVFLDIMLPLVDGQQVLAHIRDLEAARGIEVLRRTKVIMTTGLSDDENFLASHVSGCDGYLVKPVMKEAMLEMLRTLELIN